MPLQTRALTPDDLPQLLALNTAAVPAVNEVERETLGRLVELSHLPVGVVDDDAPAKVVGFALAMLADAPYESENYRWFSKRTKDFLYVDRIVVADGARGHGIGQLLYAAVFEAARAAGQHRVFCEVNVEPPNPGSMRFHGRLGFTEIGQQATKGGTVIVAMLEAPLPSQAQA
ncbi:MULTISPECIES: GNAT family N-acetyltransferase [Subtercola]|uniref:GNAT family N-acetyltransferase n=1 Tax=Subtercola TaxID=120212 RepID=UPI0013758829|nr:MULTISPECIES: GNAT family N-acetyltransferase [Subtercola]MEA9986533.1 GNAT family N-acetyltransferase [Subtercola sp. RTI3]